jgi:GMP synthase-like glutamine amidotransferase
LFSFAQVLQQIDEQLSPTAALETALRGVFAGKAPIGLCYGMQWLVLHYCML